MKKQKYILIISIIIILLILLVLLLTKNPKRKFLIENNLEGLSVKEIVERLENDLNEPNSFRANIDGSKLRLGNENTIYEYELPKNEFYLSFAPYIEKTHPCAIHNLVTCRSELKDESFFVEVIDNKGNVIFQGEKKSMNNGFIGIWLPVNKKATINVRYNGLTATTEIETFTYSNTCLTTPLQLS